MLQIPGYHIVRTLAEGGMATVYLAIQENLGREVALKVMSPALMGLHPGYGERFLHEARIIAKLAHPNIVTVHDVGVHNDLYYLAMAYVPGEDLLRQRSHLSLKENIQALQQIALALDFAHQNHYVHGDIKPENILIDKGRALLADFGIARLAGDGRIGSAGTPAYMSPEQTIGAALDHRSDLYSLGVVLFWVVSGRVPYPVDAEIPVSVQHVTEPVPCLPAEVIPFQAIVDKAMAKRPEERFASGAEFADALADTLSCINLNMETDWRDLISRATGTAPDDAIFGHLSEPTFTFHSDPSEPLLPDVVPGRVAPDRIQQAWMPEPALATRFVLRPRERQFLGRPSRASFWGRLSAVALVLLATGVTIGWIWQRLPYNPLASLEANHLGADASLQPPANAVVIQPDQEPLAVDHLTKSPPAVTEAHLDTVSGDNDTPSPMVATVHLDPSNEESLAQPPPENRDSTVAKSSEFLLNGTEVTAKTPDPVVTPPADDMDQASLVDRPTGQIASPPALAVAGDDSTEVFIKAELELAAAALKAGWLTDPPKRSAVAHYQTVLQFDPDNVDAQAGLLHVANQLTRRSAERLKAGDSYRARVLLRQAAALNPGSREVQRLNEQLASTQRVESAKPLLTRAQRAHAKGALITPTDDNAFDLYHQVLQRDWTSHLALRGLAEVEVQLADEIERLWRNGQQTEAQTLYRQALQRYPSSADLQDAGRNIGIARNVERSR